MCFVHVEEDVDVRANVNVNVDVRANVNRRGGPVHASPQNTGIHVNG